MFNKLEDSMFTHPPFAIGARNVTEHGKEWYKDHIKFDEVRRKVKDIEGKVWIIDDTANPSNDTLNDSVIEIWDFTDENGESGLHGHHVGGIIACKIHGLFPSCKIAFGKVLANKSGTGKGTWIANSIDQALKSGYKVINASIGSEYHDKRIYDAIKRFCDAGGYFNAASGNDARETDYPAAYANEIEGCLSIGAVELDLNNNLKVATYSSGGIVTFVFPGTFITSCFPNNEYAELSGTSMATPFISGLVATVLAIKPNLGFTQFMDIAKRFCTDVYKDSNHRDGNGMIDALGLINYFLENDIIVEQTIKKVNFNFWVRIKNWITNLFKN